MIIPSGIGLAMPPKALKPSAITWIRSLSLTLSSSAPVRIVSPAAQAAAMNRTGNSSMASGTWSSGMRIPCNGAERTRISATGSPPTSLGFRNSMSAPISRRIWMTPVRVGLTPTCFKSTSEPGAMLAPTMKKAADEISAGTSMVVARRCPPPSRQTRLPVRPTA